MEEERFFQTISNGMEMLEATLAAGQGVTVPVVPVATSLGLRWQGQDYAKFPGPAVIEFLDRPQSWMENAEFNHLEDY